MRAHLLIGISGCLLLAGACAPSVRASAEDVGRCPTARTTDAEVIHFSAELGCGTARRVALETVASADGYYKSDGWYCRWGEGGTRPLRVGAHTYSGGFCYRASTRREATFLGRRL
ncbi:MAG TPA: hypothetical protein VK756_02795 [Solirubrobacteraceae bacterium]|nr:hypothetical protein [Solirubrobacteraceae bacterium]